MRTWNKLGLAAAAVVLAIAVGGGAYAMWGDDGGATTQDTARNAGGDDGGVEATCIEGTVDCVDTPLDGDAAGNACLVGTVDCVDTPVDEGEGAVLGMCAPGVTDCVDMVVNEAGDCGADAVACGPDVLCEEAEQAIEHDPSLTPEEVDRLLAACESDARVACDDTSSGERCLPPDCAVSSNGSIACVDEDDLADGADSSNGSQGEGVDGVAVDPATPDSSE